MDHRNTRTARPAQPHHSQAASKRRPAAGKATPARKNHSSQVRRPIKKQGKRVRKLKIGRLITVLAALAITAGIIWFILDALNQPIHMLPTIERIPEYAQETAVPQ